MYLKEPSFAAKHSGPIDIEKPLAPFVLEAKGN